MFIDLNVPVPTLAKQQLGQAASKKGKGKQEASKTSNVTVAFSPAQITAIESRIDLLVHLGYTVLAFNQTVERKVDPKTHVNTIDPLLGQLRRREGVVYLKRITIVLDEESEKGFGLTNGHAALFAPYDLIALAPTTAGSFALACLSHTQPSPLTAHVIALPLTLPRLPFNLKHTMVRAAVKNGAVFEIGYAGALGGEGDPLLGVPSGAETGAAAKRNWWAAAREVVRVTKGRGIVVSGGVFNESELRAPRDVANLITMLGVAQDVAHDASSKVPQSLILRAQTRRTYRAVFSEPKVVIPSQPADVASGVDDTTMVVDSPALPEAEPLPAKTAKKRTLEDSGSAKSAPTPTSATTVKEESARKKKKKNKSGVGS